MKHTLKILFLISLSISCAQKAREVKYSAYELVGLEKRDIFKSELKDVKEEQEETGEAFKDALTKLREIYNVDLGDLEKQYSRLKDSFDDAKEESIELRGKIKKVNTVAEDLFREWGQEIKTISAKDLRKKSSAQLEETKARYKDLKTQMEKAEAKLNPVLTKFNDQVLFLKHNLNAKAIAGLKSEAGKIQDEIHALIKEVEASSKEAQELIERL